MEVKKQKDNFIRKIFILFGCFILLVVLAIGAYFLYLGSALYLMNSAPTQYKCSDGSKVNDPSECPKAKVEVYCDVLQYLRCWNENGQILCGVSIKTTFRNVGNAESTSFCADVGYNLRDAGGARILGDSHTEMVCSKILKPGEIQQIVDMYGRAYLDIGTPNEKETELKKYQFEEVCD